MNQSDYNELALKLGAVFCDPKETPAESLYSLLVGAEQAIRHLVFYASDARFCNGSGQVDAESVEGVGFGIQTLLKGAMVLSEHLAGEAARAN